MLSSVFEYVKGATMSRCEEAETPAVAVSEPPPPPAPQTTAQPGEALIFSQRWRFLTHPSPLVPAQVPVPEPEPEPEPEAAAEIKVRASATLDSRPRRSPPPKVPGPSSGPAVGPR